MELTKQDALVRPAHDGYHPVILWTAEGDVTCRYYRAVGARSAVIFASGSEGEWDSPALGLYPRLCLRLQAEGIAALRVRYRRPGALAAAMQDVLAAAGFLRGEGIAALGLVGHGFGGAVVLRAAAWLPAARTVVTLATQSTDAATVMRLGPRCALLLVHGGADPVQSTFSSEYVYDLASEPKDLVIYEEAGHRLDEAAASVQRLLARWLGTHLPAPASRPLLQ